MADRIKLLIITHNYPRYEGDFAGVFISLLAKKLRDYDIDPVILAPHDKGCAEYEEIEGIKIYRFRYADSDEAETIAYRGNMHQLVLSSVDGIFKFKHFLECWRKKAAEVIESENIDIIGGHWLVPSGMVMKQLMKKYKLPMIMSSHGTDIRLMRKYFKVVYRYLKNVTQRFSSWTVVSNFLKDGILELDSSLENIIKVLPLPHDEKIFYRDADVKRSDNLIVSITRFTDQKRVDKLIKSFALVADKSPEAKLSLYGDGPLRENIISDINRFGLNDRVELHDPVSQDKLRVIYNTAAVVVLNSVDEGFGLALSEAMLCGAAVIGSDSGGIKDVIKHNQRGLLVEPDNIEALANAMTDLLSDNSMRRQLAENGYDFAVENYSSAKLARKYADLVKAAIVK